MPVWEKSVVGGGICAGVCVLLVLVFWIAVKIKDRSYEPTVIADDNTDLLLIPIGLTGLAALALWIVAIVTAI